MKTLIRVLETSVARNGADKPLTIGHLLNIVKMVQNMEDVASDRHAVEMNAIEEKFMQQEAYWKD